MSKYIDSEKLIAEIERRVEINERKKRTEFGDGVYSTCKDFLSLITSLQQEQPEVDLEEETDRFLSNATPVKKGVYEITRLGFKAVARHFYELGLNARKEK